MNGDILVDGLSEFTPAQLESLAELYLRRRVDVPLEIPIDVELLLERTPNVDLRTEHCLRSKYKVEGCVCTQFMSKTIFVLIDYNIANRGSDAEYNAVIAEELGHIEIHRGLIQQVHDREDFLALRKTQEWLRIEQDARYFSGALRMPRSLLEVEVAKAYELVLREYGFLGTEAIFRRLRNRIAARFDVPLEDAQRRLEQCAGAEFGGRIRASIVARSDELLAGTALYQQTSKPIS